MKTLKHFDPALYFCLSCWILFKVHFFLLWREAGNNMYKKHTTASPAAFMDSILVGLKSQTFAVKAAHIQHTATLLSWFGRKHSSAITKPQKAIRSGICDKYPRKTSTDWDWTAATEGWFLTQTSKYSSSQRQFGTSRRETQSKCTHQNLINVTDSQQYRRQKSSKS